MKLLMLIGKAGSGKNTVADLLGWKQIGFAEPLKEFCREIFGFSQEQLFGPSEKRNAPDERWPREHGPIVGYACACCGKFVGENKAASIGQCYLTPRFALQTLGTEWGRGCDPDVWAKAGIRRARNAGRDVVFTDGRFLNEARVVKEAGGKLWRVYRPGAGLKGAAGTHPSEQEIDSREMSALLDGVIDNTGSLEDLAKTVNAVKALTWFSEERR